MIICIIILSAAVIALLILLYREKRLNRRYKQQLDAASAEREQLKNDILHITHDLRTPLTSICGYVDIMKKKTDSPDLLRYLGIISESTELMKHFSESLAKYAYLFSLPVPKTDKAELNSILKKSLLEHYTSFTKHGIIPQVTFFEEDVMTSMDNNTAARIISIVLDCAAELASEDMTIHIDQTGTLTVAFLSCCDKALTSERLLNKFYIIGTDCRSSGTGLYIVKRLAERSGVGMTAKRDGDSFSITIDFPIGE